MRRCSREISLAAILLCMGLALFAPALCRAAHSDSRPMRFDIDEGAAAFRLNDFGEQSGLQLLFNYEDMKSVAVKPIHGEYQPAEALKRLLAGTTVRYEFINRKTVTLRLELAEVASRRAGWSIRPDWQVAYDDRRSPDAGLPVVKIVSAYSADIGSSGLPASVQRLDRADLDALGLVTVQGVVRTLPQVFGGGPSEDTHSVGSEARTNVVSGAGVNLRGLGAGSTLVLMNGRRLAGGGNEGVFVDVSNLPLAAIERIDILPDSSSAIYGSDAVGGIANFVMRDKFEGRQTEAYFGGSTRGNLAENYVSQLVGLNTDRGHGLLALDFYSRDNLAASSRRQAKSDLTEFGGTNFDTPLSNPGNIVLGATSWAVPRGQDGTALLPSDFQRGTQNLQNQYEATDILPSQQRWSGFGTWRQDLTENLSIFGDALVGQRNVRRSSGGEVLTFQVPPSNHYYVNPTGVPGPVTMRYNFLQDLGPQLTDASVKSNNFTGGLEWSTDNGWRAVISAGYASERIRSIVTNQANGAALLRALASPSAETAFNPFGDGSHTSALVLESLRGYSLAADRSSLTSGDVFLRGPVMRLPGGDLTLAFGGDTRKQSFHPELVSNATVVPTDTHDGRDRSIHSGFVEVELPIFGPDFHFRGAEALTLSVAERYEHYSDFGKALATRLGLSWAPVAGVTVRSNYSESFRPPGLLDLSEDNNVFAFTALRDPQSESGVSMVMLWGGKNRDLQEEKARTWTASLELQPLHRPGTALALTYFNTHFTNRLSTPSFTSDLLSAPTMSTLVTRNPSAEYREDVCNRAPQIGSSFGNCLTTPVEAIVDLRLRNDAVVHTRGFDMLARYARDTSLGQFLFSLNGTYVLEFAEGRAAGLPLVNRVSTQSYPIDLTMRGNARWQFGGFDLSAFVNYMDSYTDIASAPHRHVSSWTTLDLHVAYTLDASAGSWLGDTTFALGANNVFDKDPPFLNNAVGAIGYDQENGDLTGRVLSMTIRKKW